MEIASTVFLAWTIIFSVLILSLFFAYIKINYIQTKLERLKTEMSDRVEGQSKDLQAYIEKEKQITYEAIRETNEYIDSRLDLLTKR